MLAGLVQSMRPLQWTKNLFIYAGLIFSEHVFDMPLLGTTSLAFAIFCLLTGGIYIVNDVVDIPADSLHPAKKTRPIASGRIPRGTAIIAGILCLAIALVCSFALSREFGLVALIYALLMLLYSLFLKEMVILDVLIISTGFILRVVAGAVLIGVTISSWLLICTIFLSLFLALGKRRYELALVQPGAEGLRPVLHHYSRSFLDQLIAVTAASTLLSYALYTVSESTVEKFGSQNLEFTIPFVVYGVFRYLYLIYVRMEGGNPGRDLFMDRALLVDVILWVAVVLAILYRR